MTKLNSTTKMTEPISQKKTISNPVKLHRNLQCTVPCVTKLP